MLPSVNPPRLSAALALVLVGLAGRALIDKLLAAQGGAAAVAAWAQLSNVADVIAGVSLTGIGTALIALAAGAVRERMAWLKPALVICLALSLAVGLLGVLLLLRLDAPLLPGNAALPFLALLAGWFAVAPGLLTAWLVGAGQVGRAAGLVAVGFALPLAFLLLRPLASLPLDLLAGQALFGFTVTAALALLLRGQPPASRADWIALLRFLPAGLAIGILSPAATVWVRLEVAHSLSWEAVGQVQALWRASDWITAIMAGLLQAHFLRRLGAAGGRARFLAELRRAALAAVVPAALLLGVLWLALPEVLALLYRADIAVTRADAAFFLLGDLLRVASWVALYGLFARRAAGVITLGEFLSLPLFALLLALCAGRYGLREAGMLWAATYLAYAAFNAAALWRALPPR